MTTPVQMGIVSAGTAFGELRSVAETAAEYLPDDPEVVADWGYETYYRAPAGSTADLGAAAGREALERAGLEIGDVDLIVVGASDIPDYLGWDPSAAVARGLNSYATPVVLVHQACATWSIALDHAAGAMALSPDTSTVLLVLVNVASESHANRMSFTRTVSSDGAVATVLRRDHPRLRRVASAQFTKPEYADFYRIEYGGAVAPVPPPDVRNVDINPLPPIYRHFGSDPDRFEEFLQEIQQRFTAIVDQACSRAGRDRSDISWLISLNDNQQAIQEVADTVGLPLERTNARLARRLGHMGTVDQLLCLWQHIEDGDLQIGDLVALVSTAVPGMHWVCTLIEV